MAVNSNEKLRFKFGRNWKDYAKSLNEDKIRYGEIALQHFLGDDLSGKSFIDVGSGSGLHSLCAKRMNAAKIFSFDYDLDSVECTKMLKDKYYAKDASWTIVQGSILDKEFIKMAGQYDIVYSWGVLHHTGSMWEAIENTISLTKEDSLCFIAIYNNQGYKSKFWWYIKYGYNKLPAILRKPYALVFGFSFELINILKYLILFKPKVALKPLLNYKKNRGMDVIHDMIDWMGGFPFEYATLNELNTFFAARGFELLKANEAKSTGCHEVIYQRKVHL